MGEKELFDMRKTIKLTLLRIGLRCDLIGFCYLCYAIELVILQPELIHNLCNNLYVLVGQKFEVNSNSSVERSIRHVIDNAFINRGFSKLNQMFKTKLYRSSQKPTAGELIRLVAEYYNIGLYKAN